MTCISRFSGIVILTHGSLARPGNAGVGYGLTESELHPQRVTKI
jgi:hypothetical protein